MLITTIAYKLFQNKFDHCLTKWCVCKHGHYDRWLWSFKPPALLYHPFFIIQSLHTNEGVWLWCDSPADSTAVVCGVSGFGFGWRGWIGAAEGLCDGRYTSSFQSFNWAPAVVLNSLLGYRSSAHVCSFWLLHWNHICKTTPVMPFIYAWLRK